MVLGKLTVPGRPTISARYRLKYCLKGPLSPKQPTNQPTESAIFVSLICPLLSENLYSELILQFDQSFPDKLYEPYGIYKHYIRL